MKKNTLEDYKEAVKAKYEEEKSGYYGSFLINPSSNLALQETKQCQQRTQP